MIDLRLVQELVFVGNYVKVAVNNQKQTLQHGETSSEDWSCHIHHEAFDFLSPEQMLRLLRTFSSPLSSNTSFVFADVK